MIFKKAPQKELSGRADIQKPIQKNIWTNSIAVLPFKDISQKKDLDYYCEGMTETIISILSRVCPELKIISKHSVMLYKETAKDIKTIGQELGVASVLEGSIMKRKGIII